MSKRYIMGDIHGGYRALVQCLERSGFDKEEDVLIQLGDVVDGWTETYECVEELLTIKNLITIKGNHDEWFRQWLVHGEHPCGWLHGGWNTLASYCEHADKEYKPYNGGYVSDLTFLDIPESHRNFFKNQILYCVDEDHNLFVHGGFNRHHPIDDQLHNDMNVLIWDRDLWYSALSYKDSKYKFKMHDDFKEVFIGHTSTTNWRDKDEITDRGILIPRGNKITTPMQAANIWNMDTGGGWDGRLTMMNIDTKEIFQSDLVQELYEGQRGRM